MIPRALELLALVGLLLLLGGVAWGVLHVGVPSQSPSAEQQAYEAFHGGLSGWLMGAGLCTLSVSAFLALVRKIVVR